MCQDQEITTAPIAAEEDDWNDNDSALGNESSASSTISISDSIFRYRQENGRTYHAYKDGKYIMPNDEIEQDRLDLQHHLISLTLENRLFLCPAGKENTLHRVLDVGTGTGIWAIDFADEHVESEVIGIDLSPIQPSFIPPNLSFQIDDLEEPWNFSQNFDFIYTRMMNGSFADWPRFFEQAYENLNPGGFIELLDTPFPFRNDDNTWPENSALKRWSELLVEGCALAGRPADASLYYEDQLKDAGFVNINRVEYKWPINRWPKDKKLKELENQIRRLAGRTKADLDEIGMWTYEDFCGGIQGISLAILTRALGWSVQEVDVFLMDVRKEFKNTKIHSYIRVDVVWAQKPLADDSKDK